MYPVSTSFIPLTVSLAKFITDGGNIWGHYPYWYLGVIPFRYLTGPIVPMALAGLHRLFSGLTLFDWLLVLIVVSWFVAAFGWGTLALQLSRDKKVGVLVGVLTFILPWHIVASLALGEVSAVVASSFGPWVLLAFARISNLKLERFVGEGQISNEKLVTTKFFLPVILFAILLLINTIASIPTILGLGIISLVLYKHSADGLRRAGLVVLLGGLLTIWWYSSGYWLKILFAPSFGGRSVIETILHIIDVARTLLPVVFAFVFVIWKLKPKNNFEKFVFLWLGSFLGLTLVRFAANIHFWLDWTSWFGEIEVGLALVAGWWIAENFDRRLLSLSVVGRKTGIFLAIFLLLIGSWWLSLANSNFWIPRRNIKNTVEWRIADKLKKITKPGETVFLSGTSAFWFNSLVDVRQVRGGADQVGLRPDLAKVVWDVRMGSDGQESVDNLKKLGVNYLVVHTDASGEYYHDFEYPGKFEDLDSLTKVYDSDGDIIYRVN